MVTKKQMMETINKRMLEQLELSEEGVSPDMRQMALGAFYELSSLYKEFMNKGA